jgi:hypothetical protein
MSSADVEWHNVAQAVKGHRDQMLQILVDLRESEGPQAPVELLKPLLQEWTRHGRVFHGFKEVAAQLRRSEGLDTNVYNWIIAAYIDVSSPEQAEAALQEMQEKPGVASDAYTLTLMKRLLKLK